MKSSRIARSLVGLLLLAVGAGNAQKPQVYVATLTGKDASPPVRTRAVGTATIMVHRLYLSYKLEVGAIEGVTAACIHLQKPRPTVVMLYSGPVTRSYSGMLASGRLEAGDLGGLSMSEFLHSVHAGEASVSVHTIEHPGGEIEGRFAPVLPGGGT